MITATIITIGDELLIGQTIDTNSAWIGQRFNEIGIKIKRRIAIADEESEILLALDEAEKLSEIVITTGGLGPTNDDITKIALCKYFNAELVEDHKTLEHIREYFAKRNRRLLQVNIDQALVPNNCKVLFNAVGTAPGLQFKKNDTTFFTLPGVPFEMKHLISERIIPYVQTAFPSNKIIHKTMITSGMGESFIAERLVEFESHLPPYISLAYLPNFGMVKLRLTSNAEHQDEIEKNFNELQSALADISIAYEDKTLEGILFDILSERNQTVAIAESCTGGNIAASIVSISGASSVFKGSTVTYAIESKEQILGIRHETLEKYTDVSPETASEMAENVRLKFNADIGLSTTGYLEGTEQYFFSAISTAHKTITKKFILPYSRQLNSNLAVSSALQFLIRYLLNKQ